MIITKYFVPFSIFLITTLYYIQCRIMYQRVGGVYDFKNNIQLNRKISIRKSSMIGVFTAILYVFIVL